MYRKENRKLHFGIILAYQSNIFANLSRKKCYFIEFDSPMISVQLIRKKWSIFKWQTGRCLAKSAPISGRGNQPWVALCLGMGEALRLTLVHLAQFRRVGNGAKIAPQSSWTLRRSNNAETDAEAGWHPERVHRSCSAHCTGVAPSNCRQTWGSMPSK